MSKLRMIGGAASSSHLAQADILHTICNEVLISPSFALHSVQATLNRTRIKDLQEMQSCVPGVLHEMT